MTWAAAEAMQAAGYDITKIPMIGIGGGNGALKWWAQNPDVNMYMLADHTDVAVYATQAVLNALEGKTGESVELPTIVMDKDNLAEFVQPDLPDNVWLGGTQLPVEELAKARNN